MTFTQRIKNSLKLFRKAPVQSTRAFASADAPTVELERVEFPAIKGRMVKCEGSRKRALFYEQDYYSAFR
mgnify:CR=1 FL=1